MYLDSPQDAMLASNCEFTEGDDVYLVQFDLNLSTGWNKVEGVANPDGQGFHMGNLTESLPWFAFRYE